MATQAIFSALSDLLPSTIDPTDPTPATGNASLPAPSVDDRSLSLSIYSVITLVLSLVIKNQDMLKLMVIGGLIETFRRTASRAWQWFLDSFFITAYFDDSDDTFRWMMVWLTKQSVWAQAREVHISTAAWGQTHHKGVEIPGLDEEATQDTGFQTKRKLSYLPAYGVTHWLRFGRVWMSVNRSKSEGRDAWSRKEESIQICLFTRDHRVLRSLLQEAKKVYKAEDADTVDIYGADQYNEWYRTSTRKKRPLRSIVLEPEFKNMILDDAKDFLCTEKWYTDRGIPYRRGYLLHGVPGSGKTSLIHSIAGELGLDIYVVSLAKRGLDDASLNELICGLPARSIALMEDIDAAFHHAATARADAATTTEGPTPPAPGPQQQKEESKGVTLSGLLGALDGVAAQEGRILFATTNRYEALDEALCRPGRMDVHVEFKCATAWQARELFRCFYPPVDAAEAEAEEKRVQLTQAEADELGVRFAEAVPEGQFSMASLQGHLMRYKERPYEAVEAAPAWVEKEALRRGTGAKEKEKEKEKET